MLGNVTNALGRKSHFQAKNIWFDAGNTHETVPHVIQLCVSWAYVTLCLKDNENDPLMLPVSTQRF